MLAGILIGRLLLSRKLTDQNCDSNLELWSDSCLCEPTPIQGEGGTSMTPIILLICSFKFITFRSNIVSLFLVDTSCATQESRLIMHCMFWGIPAINIILTLLKTLSSSLSRLLRSGASSSILEPRMEMGSLLLVVSQSSLARPCSTRAPIRLWLKRALSRPTAVAESGMSVKSGSCMWKGITYNQKYGVCSLVYDRRVLTCNK